MTELQKLALSPMVRFDPAREPTSPLDSSTAVSDVVAMMCVHSRLIESQQKFAYTPGNAKSQRGKSCLALTSSKTSPDTMGGGADGADVSSAGPDHVC